MSMCIRNNTSIVFRAAAILILLIGLTVPHLCLAEEETAPQGQTYPGLNEVVPQATVVAAQIGDAKARVSQADKLGKVYVTLDKQTENLKKLEEQVSNWDDVANWQLNRLLGVQSSYSNLAAQQQKPLDIIYTHLKTLEELRSTWEQEQLFWKQWQSYLRKSGVKVPTEAFNRTRQSIDNLLKNITLVGGHLVKPQQKYAPGQEIIASRISLVDKTLDHLRLETFRRNTYSLFEADYYRQFKRELFTEFVDNLGTTIILRDGLFKRHSTMIALQVIVTGIIALLLIYRKMQSKPLTEEWTFLFRRPLSGATFITMFLMGIIGELYTGAPPSWRWVLIVIFTVAAVRLLNAIYQHSLARKVIRIFAAIFILSETLNVIGLPTPVRQLSHVLLCAAAIPTCWFIARKRQQEIPQLLLAMYAISGVALIGLITAILGFATLTTNLINATLNTFILVIFMRMALRMSDGGIIAFMHLSWIRSRQFMIRLGIEEATQRLQTLLRIIILFNAGLYFLVVWKIFDHMTEARTALFSLEYSVGEFSLSLEIVFMVAIVLYLTSLISWVIQAFVDSQVMTPRKMDYGVKSSMKRLIHYGLFLVGFLVAISMAGIELQKFTILAGAFGVGIGFGMQNIVNNFISGLILLFERPVKVGDTINLGEDWGTITKIGLRSTILETFDRSEVIVPNADLISQKVTNWTFSSKVARVVLPVGVAYGSPLEKVLEILTNAGNEHPDVLNSPPPNPIFVGFGNSSIDFELRAWIRNIDDRLRIRSELGLLIDRLFREEKIEIPFPQRDLHLRTVASNLQAHFGAPSAPPKTDTEGISE